MYNEPDYIAQTSDEKTVSGKRDWIEERKKDARVRNLPYVRVSRHPDIEHLLLFEAWKIRPAVYPEPSWSLELVEDR